MPAKKPFPFPRPYACDFPECTQSFAEFAHLRSHQRSHQNKNKKLKAASSAFSTPPPSSNSPSESHLDQNNSGSTPLSTAPSSPRVSNTPLTAQEYLQQRKLQLQQQQLLLLAPAVPPPVVRKNKRKQPTPIKSPKRPDCLEKPPGIVFVFPTWLDIPPGNNAEKQLASNVQTREASEESLGETEKAEQDVNLAHVDVEDAEEMCQRKKRPTPLRLNSSDFVVLVHPTTDKQLLAATLEGLKPQQQQQQQGTQPNPAGKDARGLKKAPLSQDNEEAEVVSTQTLTPSLPTGTTTSPTGIQPMEDGEVLEEDKKVKASEGAGEENRRAGGEGGMEEDMEEEEESLMGKATPMIHERMAEGQVVMA